MHSDAPDQEGASQACCIGQRRCYVGAVVGAACALRGSLAQYVPLAYCCGRRGVVVAQATHALRLCQEPHTMHGRMFSEGKPWARLKRAAYCAAPCRA
ncbi:Ribonuclease P protein component [Candidatus Tremblaya princeps]|uniref:Ribonuclease P protein component n=1 Tax=Tremblaya princeps TaxID=189385 RepID=A0A143WPH4_TREPR|nr:Ribonuclease P protein component [Candidatus Tremblaya princeps]